MKQAFFVLFILMLSVICVSSAVSQGTGKVALAWDYDPSVPNIGGFKIYHGTTSGNYTSVVTIADPTARQNTVESLPQGIRFFVATVYKTTGEESGYSNQVFTTVGMPKSPTGIGISNN